MYFLDGCFRYLCLSIYASMCVSVCFASAHPSAIARSFRRLDLSARSAINVVRRATSCSALTTIFSATAMPPLAQLPSSPAVTAPALPPPPLVPLSPPLRLTVSWRFSFFAIFGITLPPPFGLRNAMTSA